MNTGRKTTGKQKYFIVFAGFVILLCASYWIFGHGKKSKQKAIKANSASYSIPRKIQYSFTVQNTTNHLLKKAELWTYAPVKQTATQRCVSIQASHPYQQITDNLGNQILHFSFKNLPPYSTKIITIKANLNVSDISNPIDESNKEIYLQPEKYLESDNPEIILAAKKLTSSDPLKTAQNTFRWVSEHIKYTGYLSKNLGALYALKHKKGDCTEFMYLFAAICRANRIPSRCIGGYVVKNDSILKPNGYHNWAEFYEDGEWKISDPQNKVFMQNLSHYIAFNMINRESKDPMDEFSRFRFMGDGLKVKMNS